MATILCIVSVSCNIYLAFNSITPNQGSGTAAPQLHATFSLFWSGSAWSANLGSHYRYLFVAHKALASFILMLLFFKCLFLEQDANTSSFGFDCLQ